MTNKAPVYLDNNATTPMDPRVLDEMLPYFLEKFGNAASRTHAFGWEADEAVGHARESIAALVGASVHEIVFTSGATEAVNLALKGVFESSARKGNHIITVQTEHKAVLDTCLSIEKKGGQVTYLPVEANGLINLQMLEASITDATILIAVMYANNETGVIQPIKEIGEIAARHGVYFFTDATQAVGKIPVNVAEDHIHLLAFSAHKLYGPKGVGVLYTKKKNGPVLTAQIDGGGHERNRRSGTLNVPGVVGLGKACEIAEIGMESETARLRALRDRLEAAFNTLGGIVNGTSAPRLPHCTHISFPGIDGEKLMFQASGQVAFSQSSACTSATIQPSHVLMAMGIPEELIHNSFRISLGRFTTPEDIDLAIEVISELVKLHRSERN
ncbi:MAG TPA: cysteine desulfurase family protein [Dyadobacter sp.]|jgi:cysteine desulfurase|nr:cysteine desulfurase family protein [Dyadobacter sp.]